MADEPHPSGASDEPAPLDPSGIEQPHDVLAAEEFAMPVPAPGADAPLDPSGIEHPHDVLAAEEFAMPVGEAAPFPGDPAGIDEPHDVLAAEDFALPASGADRPAPVAHPSSARRNVVPIGAALAALAAVAAYALRRRR